MLVNTALLTFLSRLGSTLGGSDLLVFDDTWPSAWSSSSAGNGALRRCDDGFGCWATWRREFDDGIRRIPMLACRCPTGGRRCWYVDGLGAELLLALWRNDDEEGALRPH
jgi:hypothetical protein